MEQAEDDNDRRNPVRRRMLPLRLQDLDSWVERHGLQEPEYGIAENWAEARARLRQESSYQQSVHHAIFGSNDDDDDDGGDGKNGQSEDQKKAQRARLLEAWKDETMVIETSSTPIRQVPLLPLASASDTVFAMASHRHVFGGTRSNHSCYVHNNLQQQQQPQLVLCLESFDRDAVLAFVETVVGTKTLHLIHPDHIVACCQISHYLQCNTLLDDIVEILIGSIDTANCLSICQLADSLNLPRLFEQSLVHMMQTLGELQEKDQVWGDLTPELRERILAIKSAIQSSAHTQDRGRIYFGSLTEYLAIFAENIQYHRERLEEAKERQRELVDVAGPASWIDAQMKIDKHEQRVRTLEIVMEEQKKLFGGGNNIGAFSHTFCEDQENALPRNRPPFSRFDAT